MSYWDTDVREHDESSFARDDLRGRGLYDVVRRFLLDVIQRDIVTPEEWRDLCNVEVDDQDDVRADAEEFWDWLFDEEPLTGRETPRGPISPPQA